MRIQTTITAFRGYPLFALTVFLCCQNKTSRQSATPIADTTITLTKPESAGAVHWSYSKEGGPEGWAKLSPVYADCDSGKTQSPINLASNASKGSPKWKIEYKTTTLKIAYNEHVEELIDNGHTIQISTKEGSTFTYNGKIYHLRQFHFHTPSEHTIDGKHFPMEVHFVHESDDKNLAVIGVLVQEGKHNANFDQLIKYLPNSPGEKLNYDSVNINIAVQLPADLFAYHYIGSLTTPPCTENVQWLVLLNKIILSKEQIYAFSSRLKNNNRPTQPLKNRIITLDDISVNK